MAAQDLRKKEQTEADGFLAKIKGIDLSNFGECNSYDGFQEAAKTILSSQVNMNCFRDKRGMTVPQKLITFFKFQLLQWIQK